MNFAGSQIFIMAILTFCISATGWGILFTQIGDKNPKLIWLSFLMLPFSFLVNYFVKSPLNELVMATFDIDGGYSIHQPIWYLVFFAFLAPITEELIKGISLVVPTIQTYARENGLWIGAWCGLGFGLGEILYLAWGISMTEQYAGTPWYAFTGFLGERITVCLIHGMLTGIFFRYISKGKGFQGFVLVVLLHLGVNSGAILLGLQLIKPWATSVLFVIMMIGVVIIFEKQRKQWENARTKSGKTKNIVYFQRT